MSCIQASRRPLSAKAATLPLDNVAANRTLTWGPWACRHPHQAPTKKDGFSDSEGQWLLLIHLLKNIWGSSVVTSEKKGSPRQLPHSNFLKGLLASSQRELLQPLLRSRAVRGWNLSVEAGTWKKVPNNYPPPPFTSEGGRNYTLGGEIWDGSATFPEMPQVRPSLSHTEAEPSERKAGGSGLHSIKVRALGGEIRDDQPSFSDRDVTVSKVKCQRVHPPPSTDRKRRRGDMLDGWQASSNGKTSFPEEKCLTTSQHLRQIHSALEVHDLVLVLAFGPRDGTLWGLPGGQLSQE